MGGLPKRKTRQITLISKLTLEFDPLAEQLIPELQAMLIAGDYRTSEYKVFEMFETIQDAHYSCVTFLP